MTIAGIKERARGTQRSVAEHAASSSVNGERASAIGAGGQRLQFPCPMASYEDIKTEAIRLHHDKASPDGTKKMAEIVIALCDRLAELEQRHRTDIHRLENWLKNLRQ